MRRFPTILAIAGILAAQLAFGYMITLGEHPPIAPVLSSLPRELGTWNLVGEHTMEPDVLNYLRPDDYVDRNYQGSGAAARINLFVAYFKSLKSGYGPHSPAVCLPGAGWAPKRVEVIHLAVLGSNREIPVNQYILEKDKQNLLVLYWYQNERHIWAEEFRAKIYMLPDLLRYHRSDVALVRVITPLNLDEVAATQMGVREFVQSIFPSLETQLARSSN